MKVFRRAALPRFPRAGMVLFSLALVVTSSAQKNAPPSPPKTNAPAAYARMPLNTLTNLADKGDTIAQNELGLVYAMGSRGRATNYTEAFKWFRAAADADRGLAAAQYNLGSLYFYGQGVPKDNQEALKWYRKAADQDYVPAQYLLGWMYANGKGVDEDYKESLKWYQKAAEHGDREAQYSLGLMYLRGEDFNPDYIEAYKWINLAAANGNTNAIKYRRKLSVSMTPEQIAEGQRRASQLTQKPSGDTDRKK